MLQRFTAMTVDRRAERLRELIGSSITVTYRSVIGARQSVHGELLAVADVMRGQPMLVAVLRPSDPGELVHELAFPLSSMLSIETDTEGDDQR